MAAQPEVGVRFPFVSLAKALNRAKQVYDAANGRELLISDAFKTWGYSEKSSGGHQTIAALKMYGLMADIGGGESRKITPTEHCTQYFLDERPEVKAELIKEFALAPRLIRALWDEWGKSPPEAHIARSHLKLDRRLSEQAARSLLGIYKENMDFANLKGGDKVDEEPPEEEIPPGDFSNEVLRLDQRRRRKQAMSGEREVFREEGTPEQYVYMVASGEVDEFLLEALEDYVKRQRKRLERMERMEQDEIERVRAKQQEYVEPDVDEAPAGANLSKIKIKPRPMGDPE